MIHQPVSVSSRCSLIAWLNGLASGDQRRLTGSGSTLMPCSRRWAIQMAVFTLLVTLDDILSYRISSSVTQTQTDAMFKSRDNLILLTQHGVSVQVRLHISSGPLILGCRILLPTLVKILSYLVIHSAC